MSFADVLSPTLTRLRLRYQRSPMPRFLRWWLGELRDCLPARWRQAIEVREAELWFRLEETGLRLHRVGESGSLDLGQLELADREGLTAAFGARLGEEAAALPRILLLPEALVLRRRLQLPMAARDNLHAVLGFELDRQTPFRADQVHFDSRVLEHPEDARSLPVELALVLREPMRQALDRLGPLAAELDAVDVVGDAGRAGYNFLPVSERRRRNRRQAWIQLGLIAASLLLLLMAAAQLVENRREAVVSLQAEVETQRSAARAVANLRKSLDDAVAGANFLAVQKAQRPSMLELLAELTAALPDDTFLERMTVSGRDLSLSGQSAQAAQLIERLRATASVRSPALAGAVQPDARSGKDRFTINARIGSEPVEDADAVAARR